MNTYKDLALVRELYRVTNEVHQHLAETNTIAYDQRRNVVVDLVDKVDTGFCSLRGKHIQYFFDPIAHSGTALFEFHLTRFDLGVVEDIIDNDEETFTAVLDRVGILALFF